MLNEALRLMRVFHDMSLTEAASRLGVAKSYVSEIEHGKKAPTLQLIEKYAEVFDIPASSILFFSEHLRDGSAKERTRLAVSKKVLAILDFIAARSGRQTAAE